MTGAVLLSYAFVQSAIDMFSPDYGNTTIWGVGGTFVIGVGSLACGGVLMLLWALFRGARPFFRGDSLNENTEVLVPADQEEFFRSINGGHSSQSG